MPLVCNSTLVLLCKLCNLKLCKVTRHWKASYCNFEVVASETMPKRKAMPKYVLHYFGIRARGEIIRLLLTVAGQEFEDHRFSLRGEWPGIKGGM